MALRSLTALGLLLAPLLPLPDATPSVPVESFRLANGMEFLVAWRAGSPFVAAGWAAHGGSGDESPGATGAAHLLEHLLFHGTRTIGARDAQRETRLMARRDRLEEEIRASAPGPERGPLEAEAAALDAELRALWKKGEYALLYTEAGAVGINAVTREDFTAYFLMVPAARLELWFWMESNRLLEPVLRGLHAEYGVVEEERRQRLDSTPEGTQREAFRERFWGAGHPYSWPPVGRAADLRTLRRADLEAFLAGHYRPSRLTAVLVGDVDVERVRALATRYFGRLADDRPSEMPSPAPSPSPPGPEGEVRFEATCACPPQVEVRYRTVPWGHADAVALDALAGLLNGRTGRLHRSLVLDEGLAFAASAQHLALRRAGSFSVAVQGREEVTPEQLEAAWEDELAGLVGTPVPAAELEKVKRQLLTESWREVREPLALALRLLVYDSLGEWGHLHAWPAALQSLTGDDLRRAAATHLRAERRGVAILRRAGP